MSAGIDEVELGALALVVAPAAKAPAPTVSRDMGLLAPRFREAVQQAIAACRAAGYDAMVYEALRSEALQALYYARGRTVRPPDHTVTMARSNLYSWHGFGLAVDVVSTSERWFNIRPGIDDLSPALRKRRNEEGQRWFTDVATIAKRFALDWGGDWKSVDLPHWQWGRLRATPSDRARELYRAGGLEAVWRDVGAL